MSINYQFGTPYAAAPVYSPVEAIRPGVKRFGYVILASSVMSYVPQADLWTIPCVLALLFFGITQVFTGQIRIPDARTLVSLVFVIQCALSYLVLTYNGYGFSEWFRAAAPFSLFLLLLLIPQLNVSEQNWLSRMILIAGLLWVAKILGQAAFLALQGSDVFSVRLTFRVIDSVIVFPLVMIPYLLFVPLDRFSYLRFPLIGAVMLLYVWIGYRAGLVFITLPFFVYVATQTKRFNLAPLILLLFAAYGAFVAVNSDMFGLSERFSRLNEESGGVRGQEWQYAIDSFLQSPIVGKGLGWQVPTAYIETDDPFFQQQSATVGFVHSALAYFAMNMGIIGVATYYYLTLPRYFGRDRRDIQKFATIALILLAFFCLTQAAFRTVHTVLLMVALIRINSLPVRMPARFVPRRQTYHPRKF